MARKHYAHRTPPRAIRSSGEEVQEGGLEEALDPVEQPTAIHEFQHGEQAQEDEIEESQDREMGEAEVGLVHHNERRPEIAQLIAMRSKMTPSEWAIEKAGALQVEDPEEEHDLNLLMTEVDETFQLRHEFMTRRIERLRQNADNTTETREASTNRAAFEGVRPLREQRFESDLWLDRVVIDQLETSDNELQIRGSEEGEEINQEIDELLVLHESGDAMLADVREEYREIRMRQSKADEVADREPFSQDRATMEVRDDYTPGERHPEESSDPRRIMAVVHDFNVYLSELLPLLSVEKERLPSALVEASEHLGKMIEIADSVLLYSGVPVFDEIPRQLMVDLAKGMEAAGRARMEKGELVERSDLGGWEEMAVDDGTGKSPSHFQVLLGVEEQEVRDRISLFSLQVLQACATGPTETMEFRDLSFPG